MVKKKYVPSRGDIVWIDFNPTKGHEQSGRRPALIVSSERYNALSLRAVVCPITSKNKGHVFDVVLEGGSINGVVLSDHLRSMDWTKRNIIFIEKVPDSILEEVALKASLLIKG
jgi:mRNA interferase MazF